MTRRRVIVYAIAVFTLLSIVPATWAQGVIIPTDERQGDVLRTYRLVLSQASTDYRFTNATMDTTLFPRWGEFSAYWVTDGPNRGSFVFPDALPSGYASVSATPYTGYDWRAADHRAIAFKAYSKTVAVLRSDIAANNTSISWEAVHFRNLIDSYLLGGISYSIGEREIDSAGLIWTTQVLVVPAFTVRGTDWRFHVDSLFAAAPRLKERLLAFLARGGTIYTEGNAVYLVEKLGLLAAGAVDFENGVLADSTGSVYVDATSSRHPVATTVEAAGTRMYSGLVPKVDCGGAEVIARLQGSGNPVVFALEGAQANGGRVICNTALPTVGGSRAMQPGETTHERAQLQWAINAILSGFTTSVDVTRSVYNALPDSLSVGRNAAPYDRRDTLEIRVLLRNVSDRAVSGITVKEQQRGYFDFVDVLTPDVTAEFTSPYLTLSGIDLAPHSEKVVVYRIATPEPESTVHEKVNNYISWSTYIYASYAIVSFDDAQGAASYRKYRNYVDLMFSARIAADTDLNWKNFLGLYYQPFKVFMIMENKERTAAMGTQYVQYIPKDVPFYWTDTSIDIPILKTPGGKYVDVLRGSDDQTRPDFDMDGDGHPDVWLDTASISPKNYRIEETEVYWLNPWEHLRSGNARLYEDIDHDGKRAQDTDGDGVVDVEEPGDKIRVWKVTWDVGKMSGYEFFDPYCSYEIWVDPPDLVPMSAGVASGHGRLDEDVAGMFYPYSPDVHAPDLADTSWTHWMERDAQGNVLWKQLIWQKVGNYEGFTFIDTAKTGYTLKPTDRCAGTVPQPHREFIAVLSLGGEEIDMKKFTPEHSAYSNVTYNTIFGEHRTTPIRSTYTYYAPLPNPLQFEYVTNNFTATDMETGERLRHLPAFGKARLTFDIDASTEYSYYWIRNAGHDVETDDPSLAQEGVEQLGDGVFGYMVYDIPKGLGGYSITLPRRADGSYDTDAIVQVDGGPFRPWLSNPNTGNAVEIHEDQYAYHVYIPQLLIPPALDDDNGDGIDDWIDDRGDRFQSKTGFLHDGFMLGNGEAYPNEPPAPFQDDIYGWVTSGWSAGADGTYGDDFFETLGKTHFTIHAEYEGKGREGSIDISKGGWLVVEEIFGGSPWVLFSHALSAWAEGTNMTLSSGVSPSLARFGVDTVYVKHVIEDKGEPHLFDGNMDPWHLSYGYGQTTITTYAGGKDPCGLVTPAPNQSTIIDPARDRCAVTLVPDADPTNPDLAAYPRSAEGTFLAVRIEVSNGSDFNWINTHVTPRLAAECGATRPVLSYVSYPRPLVPAKVDPATGAVIQGGDDPRAFRAGWRFNQPEGEVLVKMGNELNLLQPSRRGYFVFLFEIDPLLGEGIYRIDFTMDGEMRRYDGERSGSIAFDVPPCLFSIAPKDARGNVIEYQKLVIGQGALADLRTDALSPAFRGLGNVRWSARDVNGTDFDTLTSSLPAMYDATTQRETIDLSRFDPFPTVERTKLYILEEGEVRSGTSLDALPITAGQELRYEDPQTGANARMSKALSVATAGPKLVLDKKLVEVDGAPYDASSLPCFGADGADRMLVSVTLSNQGSSVAENVLLRIQPGLRFAADEDALPPNVSVTSGALEAACPTILPGETRRLLLPLRAADGACARVYDSTDVVASMTASYDGGYALSGKLVKDRFTVPDDRAIDLPAHDFAIRRLLTSRPEVCPGGSVTLFLEVANGPVPATAVKVAYYGIINGADTLLLAEQQIDAIAAFSTAVLSATVDVPEEAQRFEYFVLLDPSASYDEFCESNNIASMMLPVAGREWILDVGSHPNPMHDETTIRYTLPRETRGLTLAVYDLDGREVGRVFSPPGGIGAHSVVWRNGTLPAGTYFYTFRGTDAEGEEVRFTGRVVKI